MPTLNTPISTNWTKIAEVADANLLVTWHAPAIVEFATTAADTAPTVSGHRLDRDSALTRSILGEGVVWARLAVGSQPTGTLLVVTK